MRFYLILIVAVLATIAEPRALLAQDDANIEGYDRLQGIMRQYEPLRGKPIGTITITVGNIFSNPEDSFIYNTANNLKVATREYVIKRELMFKEGDPFDPFRFQESLRYVRSLRFLRDVSLKAIDRGDHVDVELKAHDTWTIIPQVGYSNSTGSQNYQAGLSESNILGYGKRLEMLYQEKDRLKSIETVWDDNRVWGTYNRLIAGFFHREDGDRKLLFFGRPFRSLVEEYSYTLDADVADLVNRLYRSGDARYVFRENRNNTSLRFVFSRGDPSTERYRFGFGYDHLDSSFKNATLEDYKDVNVDPDSVDKDPNQLPENRRFSGPVFTFRDIVPDYISMNYIDRFDFVEDYNLGDETSVNSHFAPSALGSDYDAYLFSVNRSRGYRFSADSFVRGEGGIASRIDKDGFTNSLFRGELKYYNALGILQTGGLFLGRHTFASSLALDYGVDLDKDREFLSGGDNAIRGYEARAFTGDKRLVLNLEDRIHMVDNIYDIISLGSAFFLDVGGSTNESLNQLIGNTLYSDVGFGLRFAFPRSQGSRILRLDVAFPLRDGPDGTKAYDPRIMITGGQLFGARTRSEVLGPEKASVAIGFDN